MKKTIKMMAALCAIAGLGLTSCNSATYTPKANFTGVSEGSLNAGELKYNVSVTATNSVISSVALKDDSITWKKSWAAPVSYKINDVVSAILLQFVGMEFEKCLLWMGDSEISNSGLYFDDLNYESGKNTTDYQYVQETIQTPLTNEGIGEKNHFRVVETGIMLAIFDACIN